MLVGREGGREGAWVGGWELLLGERPQVDP